MKVIELVIEDSRLLEPEYAMTRATPGSAAVDVRACVDESLAIFPGECLSVSLGFRLHLDDPNLAAVLLPRSGLGSRGIVLGNTVGLIDSDYQGPVKASLYNRSEEPYVIQPMERVAQLMVVPVALPEFKVVSAFSSGSDRGEGGFGSTGAV